MGSPDSVRIYPNVEIGLGACIGEFVMIGEPPRGATAGQLPTRIGTDAVVRSHTIIYAGNTIGDRFQTGHGVLVREENEIGNDVSIGSGSVIEHHVQIGNGVRIHSQAFVPEYSTLEDNCWIGPNVVLTNALYPKSPAAKTNLRGPVIRRDAIIGANATLLPGLCVGYGALVGAGSVVVRDVPDGQVVVGNPAQVIKSIDELEAYRDETAPRAGSGPENYFVQGSLPKVWGVRSRSSAMLLRSQSEMADMRAIMKKLLKLLVKQMPIYQLRAAIIRRCGYTVGKDVYIGEDLIIIDEPSDWGMVSIGDRVAISPRVTLVVSSRPNFSRIAPYVPAKHSPITIENDVWLGTGVVVLPGIKIGEGAVVGANSVVTKDVRPYTIVGGSPARVIREVSVPWVEETEDRVP